MTLLQRIKNKVRARSIHVAYVDVGSCNGCDIEVLACLAPRYDIEQYGIFVHNNPREADVLLVIGAYTPGWEEKLAMVWEKIPDPKAAVAIGNCPISGCLFNRKGSFVDPPVKKHIPIAAETYPAVRPVLPRSFRQFSRFEIRSLQTGRKVTHETDGGCQYSSGAYSSLF